MPPRADHRHDLVIPQPTEQRGIITRFEKVDGEVGREVRGLVVGVTVGWASSPSLFALIVRAV